MDEDTISEWLEEAEENERHLTEWEARFLDTISHQVADGASLSSKQFDILKGIHEKLNRE